MQEYNKFNQRQLLNDQLNQYQNYNIPEENHDGNIEEGMIDDYY